MALFSDLFTESTVAEVNGNVTPDYLKGLPLAKFDENMSLLDCGAKGLVLAEAGWLDICESVRNMDILDEGIRDVAEKAKDKVTGTAKKAGEKMKAGGAKILAFLEKIPGILKKIAQNIFGTINKFLTTIAALVKGNDNITNIEAAKKGLANYKKVNGELYVKGFMFEDGADTAQTNFKKAMNAATKRVEGWSQAARDKNSSVNKYTAEEKQDLLKEIRNLLCGGAPDNGDVTSRSFHTDLKAHYGKKYAKGDQHVVTDDIITTAAQKVKQGYKDEQNLARAVYKDSKESINKYIKQCEDMAKSFRKDLNDNEELDDTKKENLNKRVNAAELAGNTMTAVSGIMSSYTGAFCQLLHQQFSTYKSILTTCVGYSKGGKVGDKVYGNKNESTSLFGLDLI